MKKQNKAGRPEGSKKGEPTNFEFWKGMLKDNQIQQFLDRGNAEQKECIKNVVQYIKNMQPEFFEQIEGDLIIKQLKGK